MNTIQKRYKFATSSSIAAMVYAVCDDHGRRLPALLQQCVQSNWLCATFVCAQLSKKVVRRLAFRFLLGYSLLSLWVENLLDSQSEHCSVTQLWRHQSVK